MLCPVSGDAERGDPQADSRMLRLQFSIETKEQTRKILNLVREAFLGESSPSVPDFEYTQGHFRRGVS